MTCMPDRIVMTTVRFDSGDVRRAGRFDPREAVGSDIPPVGMRHGMASAARSEEMGDTRCPL